MKRSDYEKTGFRTSVEIIAEHAAGSPDKIAIRQKRYGVWQEITWSELERIVRELASGLIEIGVQPGDKVGILSENRREWVLTQFAVQAVGGVVTGMYPTSPAAEIDHLVNVSDTKFLFIEDQEQFDKLVDMIINDLTDAPSVDEVIELYQEQIDKMATAAPAAHERLMAPVEEFRAAQS